MGLLDRLNSTGQGQTIVKYFDCTFTSIDDNQVKEYLDVYKRLLIRGRNIEEGKYNCNTKVAVVNKEYDFLLFQLGTTKVSMAPDDVNVETANIDIDVHEYIENYFQIKCKNELWCAWCQRIVDPLEGQLSSDENPVTQFKVEYIPEKLGREPENDAEFIRNLAVMAMKIYENKERRNTYLRALEDELGKAKAESETKIDMSWYEMLFEDETNRSLQSTNEQSKEDEGLSNPRYEMKIADESAKAMYFTYLDKLIPEEFHLEPKTYAVSEKRFAIARAFNDNDFEIIDRADRKLAFARYFIVYYNSASAIVKVEELPQHGQILIVEIDCYDKFELSERIFKINLERGIKILYEDYYKDVEVSCSAELQIVQKEKISVLNAKKKFVDKYNELDQKITLDKLIPLPFVNNSNKDE